jgi:Kef-type K+ transport system membrane component KefB
MVGLLVFGLILLKGAILFGLGRLFHMGLDQNLLFTFALAQGGEFGFVLFSFAEQQGVIPTDITSLLVAVVATSMALTPVLMLLNERFLQPRFGTREEVEREPGSGASPDGSFGPTESHLPCWSTIPTRWRASGSWG